MNDKNITNQSWGFNMTQNKKAVEKRRKEIQKEKLDNKIKHIYMQKDEDKSLFEIKYFSGRVIRERS